MHYLTLYLLYITCFFPQEKEAIYQFLTVYKWEEICIKSDFNIKNRFIETEKPIYKATTQKGDYKPVEFNFTPIPNAKKAVDVFNVIAFPTNLIIDQNGIIQTVFRGANAEIKENDYLKNNICRKIDQLLNQQF